MVAYAVRLASSRAVSKRQKVDGKHHSDVGLVSARRSHESGFYDSY